MHPEKSEENSFNTWYSKHENKGHSDITFSYPYLNILMHETKIHVQYSGSDNGCA